MCQCHFMCQQMEIYHFSALPATGVACNFLDKCVLYPPVSQFLSRVCHILSDDLKRCIYSWVSSPCGRISLCKLVSTLPNPALDSQTGVPTLPQLCSISSFTSGPKPQKMYALSFQSHFIEVCATEIWMTTLRKITWFKKGAVEPLGMEERS